MIEPNSQTWLAVRAHVERKIESHRARLETPGCAPFEADAHRGAIQELKELLRLAETPPVLPGQAGTPDPAD